MKPFQFCLLTAIINEMKKVQLKIQEEKEKEKKIYAKMFAWRQTLCCNKLSFVHFCSHLSKNWRYSETVTVFSFYCNTSLWLPQALVWSMFRLQLTNTGLLCLILHNVVYLVSFHCWHFDTIHQFVLFMFLLVNKTRDNSNFLYFLWHYTVLVSVKNADRH